MNLLHKFACAVLMVVIFSDCKKYSIETSNKAPVANAGTDVTILLPVDSVALDGSSSYDSDGRIEEYLWKQISGPSGANITNPQEKQTKATRLLQGIYSFELKITDNSGLLSKDTVIVTVQPSSTVPIVVNAGPDQVVTLPVNNVMLDGSSSNDPSGAPLNFLWRQISGPFSIISDAGATKPSATFSTAGIYRYELKVWNVNGVAYDTTSVTVMDAGSCNVTRREVPGKLKLLQQLPIQYPYGSSKMLVVGSKIVIPQDWDYTTNKPSNIIYVFDIASKTLTQKQLSLARGGLGTVVAGTKIFFAGGFTNMDYYDYTDVTDIVDIFDVSTDTWSTAKLSQARGAVKAATVGNKVVFAGGLKSNVLSDRVDIYDLQTNQWTTSKLSGEPRAIERVVTNQNNIYFLGGYTRWEDPTGYGFTLTTASKTIDVYNASTGGWTTDNMQVARYGFSAVSVDDKLIIAGGVATQVPYEQITSHVEIIKLTTRERSSSCLASPTVWYFSEGPAVKNGTVIFFIGSGEKRKLNIYNPQTGEWSLGVMDYDLDSNSGSSIVAINNEVYVLANSILYNLDF